MRVVYVHHDVLAVFLHVICRHINKVMCVCVSTYLFEEQGVFHVLAVDRVEPVLVLGGDVDLVAGQDVAHGAELLDFPLKHLLQPLVPELGAPHLLTQI